ncbi:MAG: hypothetical protein IPK03_17520 [Bacteroidetes bacterium]|nr:hypothetical protein [Bacteroidota bacterium]
MLKSGSAVNADPTSGSTYSANSTFGSAVNWELEIMPYIGVLAILFYFQFESKYHLSRQRYMNLMDREFVIKVLPY